MSIHGPLSRQPSENDQPCRRSILKMSARRGVLMEIGSGLTEPAATLSPSVITHLVVMVGVGVAENSVSKHAC